MNNIKKVTFVKYGRDFKVAPKIHEAAYHQSDLHLLLIASYH